MDYSIYGGNLLSVEGRRRIFPLHNNWEKISKTEQLYVLLFKSRFYYSAGKIALCEDCIKKMTKSARIINLQRKIIAFPAEQNWKDGIEYIVKMKIRNRTSTFLQKLRQKKATITV